MDNRQESAAPERPFPSKVVSVWADPRLRPRILLISLLVASTVSLAHRFFDDDLDPAIWMLFHGLLPTIVFSGAAIAAGIRRLSVAMVTRGLATVVAVTLGFTLVNSLLDLSFWPGLALNLLIPATVATLGAASGR